MPFYIIHRTCSQSFTDAVVVEADSPDAATEAIENDEVEPVQVIANCDHDLFEVVDQDEPEEITKEEIKALVASERERQIDYAQSWGDWVTITNDQPARDGSNR